MSRWKILALAGLLLSLPKGWAQGLSVGDEAPDFALNNQDGKAVRLRDFRGKKWVVLAFFPKAHTPG